MGKSVSIGLATPRQDWTGSNPSRREGGGCGFTLSRSQSCCAVRLFYIQISPGHTRIWTTLYLVCNYIVNMLEGVGDPKSEIWTQGISSMKSVDKSLKTIFLLNMEMKVSLFVSDAFQLVTKLIEEIRGTGWNNDLFTKQNLNACCGRPLLWTSANTCKLAVRNSSSELYRIGNHLNLMLVCLRVLYECKSTLLNKHTRKLVPSSNLCTRLNFLLVLLFIVLSGKYYMSQTVRRVTKHKGHRREPERLVK